MDQQSFKAHVKVLQLGKGEVYALELFQKKILTCRPNNDGVDIEIDKSQAVNIIKAQKKMMKALPRKLEKLSAVQKSGLGKYLETLYSGNVIWVRLSREPGMNMFACLVGLVIRANEQNEQGAPSIKVHYPGGEVKDVFIFPIPDDAKFLSEPLELECIVNWNGGKFEKNDDELCPEFMLNIMKNRGDRTKNKKQRWNGVWEVGTVTCNMIDSDVWNLLDIDCKNAFTYLELPFPLGYVPIGVSQMLMISGRVPQVYAKNVLERTLQKFHDKSLLEGLEQNCDDQVAATVKIEAKEFGSKDVAGIGVVEVCVNDECPEMPQSRDETPDKQGADDDDSLVATVKIQAKKTSDDNGGRGVAKMGVVLGDTNEQELSPIPEEDRSLVNVLCQSVPSPPPGRDSKPCEMRGQMLCNPYGVMPCFPFSSTLASSGLFSQVPPYYHTPRPYAAYYPTGMPLNTGFGSHSMRQPVALFDQSTAHMPLPHSYPCFHHPCYSVAPPHPTYAYIRPSQANGETDGTTLTAASQFQPRNLDRVDLFMRRFCDVVLADIGCEPYRNDVDEDIGLVVSFWVYLKSQCEKGKGYFSRGDCEDLTQKFLQTLLTVWKSVEQVLHFMEPNVHISAHMIRCTFYNENERKNIYHTLAALLCQDPNRCTCELRLVECTCSQIISDEPNDEFLKRINKQFASDHYQCIQWLDRYAVFEFKHGQLRHGARSYYPYAKQAIKIERDEDWAQLEEIQHWSREKVGEVVLVLMDFKQMLRNAGKREMMLVERWGGVENAEAWVQFVEAVEAVAEMAGRRYYDELTVQGEKFAAEFVRMKKAEAGVVKVF